MLEDSHFKSNTISVPILKTNEGYERALQGSEETLGPMHPDSLKTVYNLADLLENLPGHEEAAGQLMKRYREATAD